MEIRVETDYVTHLKNADGNHLAAAVLQVADVLWFNLPKLIEAIHAVAENQKEANEIQKHINNITAYDL